MDDGFVTAYAVSTGRKHRIPEHWLTHPIHSKDWRRTPKARAAARTAAATPAPLKDTSKPEPASAPAEPSTTDTKEE